MIAETSSRDIQHPADIDRLMAVFYQDNVLPDAIIGFYFDGLDLAEHLPRISAFWQRQLLGIPGYAGQSFEVHLALHRHTAITPHHFQRWLYLFSATVDALFSGPRAEFAKQRAAAIARSMQEGLANPARVGPELRERVSGVGTFEPDAKAT